MAYFVYPMNKTSRFIHSIGVMDIASDIFYNSLNNSNVKEEYLKYIEKKLELESNFINEVNSFAREKYLKDEKIEINSKIVNQGIKNLIGKELQNRFFFNDNLSILILQALRLYALFHDIGHLPFSHLGEYAILEFLKSQKENKKINKLFKKLSPKPHEIIGKKLVELIFNYLKENIKNKQDISSLDISSLIVLEIIYKIYNKIESKEIIELYKIVSSDLDADRLDYTIRDGYASGIYYNSFDIDRVIKTFYLVKDQETFKILPSIKALFDINRFYFDRFNLYKMVINHHKVKRFDFILQLSIEKILKKEFEDGMNCKDKINIDKLIDMICVIDELIDFKKSNIEEIKRLFFKFTQLTDFWLLNIIKQKVIESIFENKNIEFELFNEILAGTKTIKSLYKRSFDFNKKFNEIDEKQILLLDNLKSIDNKVFIVKIKEANYPDELEIYDPKEDKIFKYIDILQDFINTKKTAAFFIFYNSNEIEEEQIIKLITDELKKEPANV